MSEVKYSALCTELRDVEWQTLAEKLGIPSVQIRTIQLDNPHNTGRCRLEMLDWWMKNGEDISWAHVAVALRNMYQDHLAERIVRRYCSRVGMDGPGDSSGDGPCRTVIVDRGVVECLLKLKYGFSEMTSQLYQLITAYLRRNPFTRRRKTNEFIVTLSTFLGKESHKYPTFNKIYDEFVHANDMFQVTMFKLFVQLYFQRHPSYLVTGNEYIHVYEMKKNSFLEAATLQQFRDAVFEAVPHGLTETRYDHLTLVLSEHWANCVLKELKDLMFQVFGVHQSVFLDIKITYGSVVVQWKYIAVLKPILVDLALRNLEVLKKSEVIELSIGGETLYSLEKAQEVQFPVSNLGSGELERTNELLASDQKIIEAKADDMREQTKERKVIIGTGVGFFSGGLMRGSVGGGAGALIGGIVGSIVPGPGTAVGIVVGTGIGAAIGAGGVGTAIGYAVSNHKENKKKKTRSTEPA